MKTRKQKKQLTLYDVIKRRLMEQKRKKRGILFKFKKKMNKLIAKTMKEAILYGGTFVTRNYLARARIKESARLRDSLAIMSIAMLAKNKA